MKPEIPVPQDKVDRIVLTLPCPEEGCGGRIQTYEVLGKPLRATCYECGTEVDLNTVKIVYERKG